MYEPHYFLTWNNLTPSWKQSQSSCLWLKSDLSPVKSSLGLFPGSVNTLSAFPPKKTSLSGLLTFSTYVYCTGAQSTLSHKTVNMVKKRKKISCWLYQAKLWCQRQAPPSWSPVHVCKLWNSRLIWIQQCLLAKSQQALWTPWLVITFV